MNTVLFSLGIRLLLTGFFVTLVTSNPLGIVGFNLLLFAPKIARAVGASEDPRAARLRRSVAPFVDSLPSGGRNTSADRL